MPVACFERKRNDRDLIHYSVPMLYRSVIALLIVTAQRIGVSWDKGMEK